MKIAGGLLRLHLDLCVLRNQVFGNRNAVFDFDATVNDGVVLHVAHRMEIVNLLDAKKAQAIGHELLETRVLSSRHAFGTVEISRRRVAARLAFARIVDQKLSDLAERPSLLTVVSDQTHPTR